MKNDASAIIPAKVLAQEQAFTLSQCFFLLYARREEVSPADWTNPAQYACPKSPPSSPHLQKHCGTSYSLIIGGVSSVEMVKDISALLRVFPQMERLSHLTVTSWGIFILKAMGRCHTISLWIPVHFCPISRYKDRFFLVAQLASESQTEASSVLCHPQ